MANKNYFQAIDLIEKIELTEQLLQKLNTIDEDVNQVAYRQIESKKRSLYKKLLIVMIEGNLGFGDFETLYHKIIDYLKTEEGASTTSLEQKKHLHKAGQYI